MISTANIDKLIPDFLMESGHFYVVITDVEGKIIKGNRNFERIAASSSKKEFWKYLSINAAEEFAYSLELMLSAPKITRHLLLEHPIVSDQQFSQIWWEFSVITTPDMDISGIIGVGVGMQFLEQEMPWNNLVDVLGFGKITLDSNFLVKANDEKISSWFSNDLNPWIGKSVLDLPCLEGGKDLERVIFQASVENKPTCFLIQTNDLEIKSFASLLVKAPEGYHLFLVPKEVASAHGNLKPLVKQALLESLAEATFVLDMNGKLVQQNNAAKNLGRIWKGRAYSEGHVLSFPNQTNRFNKLQKAIDDAKIGKEADVELKMLMPDKEFAFWRASARVLRTEDGGFEGMLLSVLDITSLRHELIQLNRENERLRDLALSPSHILRGPLSTIMGILELIDPKQLDDEGQKLFGYLKPLSEELDTTIRQHAKKMSAFI